MLGKLARSRPTEERLSMQQVEQMLWDSFKFNGQHFVIPSSQSQHITAQQGAANAVVFSCLAVRLHVFSEIRFTWQRYSAGRPGEMFGTPALSILERPWPTGSTGDLLARMEIDASLYGNSYHVRVGSDLVRLDPQHVQIVTADHLDEVSGKPFGQRLMGYAYSPSGQEAAFWTPDEVAHYAPLPDPEHPYRGVSWLNAVLPDVIADRAMTGFKSSFIDNAATPNLAVVYPPGVTKEQVERVKEVIEARHSGPENAGKTLYMAGGADVKTIGSNFNDLALKATQGAGETRIAAAAGVPASIVGISEGLAGSALNSGNYTAARRRFADGTMRPLWRSACSALQVIARPPDAGARLWFDDRDVSFLQEDVKDEADIRAQHAQTIKTLVEAGYTPGSVVEAVTTGDFTALAHSGLLSVQLQEPGAQAPAP